MNQMKKHLHLHQKLHRARVRRFSENYHQEIWGVAFLAVLNKRRRKDLVPGSDLFKKMIPEVVNSLVDIFTKSTSTHFRSQVGAFIPTSSRMNMSVHLEKQLWGMIRNPLYRSDETQAPVDPSFKNSEELIMEDWEFSLDSLFSSEEWNDGNMSPDSLDREAETSVGTPVGGKMLSSSAPVMKDTDRTLYAGLEVPGDIHTQPVSGDVTFEDIISAEEELELWKEFSRPTHLTDADNCVPGAGLSSSYVSPSVHQGKSKFFDQHLVPPCGSSHDKYFDRFNQDMSTSRQALFGDDNHSENNVLAAQHDCGIPVQTSQKSFPRKRSSEYMDDGTECEECCQVLSSVSAVESDCQDGNKKQRFDDAGVKTALIPSHDRQNFILASHPDDNDVTTTYSKSTHTSQNEEDSDWFNEEEIISWCAQMAK